MRSIEVNGQEIFYVIINDSDAIEYFAQQVSDYRDQAGRRLGHTAFVGYPNANVIILASTRTIANMIYRREFLSS